MFSDSKTFSKFISEAFPEIAPKLNFSILIDEDNGKQSVVLFFNEALYEKESKEILEFLSRFSNISDVILQEAGIVPLTGTIVLSKIKELQPVKYDVLLQKIRNEKVEFEESVLKGQLDKLRKSKMIIRSVEGLFSVTEKALGIIPHGNTRNSSDIKRLLELGKRKW